VGTGWVVDRFGWDGGFALFIGAALLGALLFLGTADSSKRRIRDVDGQQPL